MRGLVDPRKVEQRLLSAMALAFMTANSYREPRDRFLRPRTLEPLQVAMLVDRIHTIREVTPGGANPDDGLGMLAVYQAEGEFAGTYRRGDLGLLEQLAHQFNPTGNEGWFKEFQRALRRRVEKRPETVERDLVAMKNCIYNYATGERLPLTPDYVTLAKFDTNLPETEPPVPQIMNEDGTVWNAYDWFCEVVPEEDTRLLVLQIIGACLRSDVDWQVMPIFYSELGANGKGTVLELTRSIVGDRLVANVPLSKYGSEFGLAQIVAKRVNLVDENDVGAFIEAAANLKSVITNDVVTINRKHRDEYSYKPRLFNIQSMNEFPKFKDKTDAMLRRLLFVVFPNRFTEVTKNRAIKDDYVKRDEVREWFAYQALVSLPKYYKLSEPKSTAEAKREYRIETDPVVAYWDEFGEKFQRDFLPFGLLHGHLAAWHKEMNPRGTVEGQAKVTRKLKTLVDPDEWIVPQGANGKDVEFSLAQWLVNSEPVLGEYKYVEEVRKWDWDPHGDNSGGAVPHTAPRTARGFVRRSVYAAHMAVGSTPYRARRA